VRPVKFEIYQDAAGEFRWRLKSTNGKTIADSGEGYTHRGDCVHGISLVLSAGRIELSEMIDDLTT